MRFGISMADVPLTTGQPDRGAGAYKFTGLTLYDPLVAWELDVADRPGKLIPGLATEWKVNEADKTLWTFKLRDGVKFHDGSAFNADAVVWNLEKVFNKDAPQFDQRQAAQVRPRLPSIASYKKTGEMEVEIKTKAVDALFPYQMLWFLVSSPTQWEKLGKDWNKFASEPSGTGPFKLARLVPRERAELVKNEAYWNPKRIPKTDRLVLIVAPEDSARTAALLSNAVDMIETPPPDAVARLKQGGMRIEQNVTPHVWNYHPSLVEGSPWTDIRLRKAANLAIDRESIVKLLNGLARPAYGQVDKTNPWFGKPTFELKYAPDEARKLTSAAGFSKAQPAQDQVRRRLRRHRPDAVAADERGDPGDVQGGLHRRRVQGGRARGDVHRLARRREGRHEQGHHGEQHRLRDVRPGLRHHPLLRLEPGGAGRRELELLQERRGRQAGQRGAQHLRCRQAGRVDGPGAREGGRRRGADLGRARHQPARAVAQDQVVRPGPALVPGPDDDRVSLLTLQHEVHPERQRGTFIFRRRSSSPAR